MPKYELTGAVRLLHDPQTFASGFTKREFVVETGGKYPQLIKLECVKDRVADLDKISPGDVVNVSFDIRGSEYKDRHYVNLVAWKVEATGEREEDQHSRRNPMGGVDRTANEAMGKRDNGGSEPDDGEIPFMRKPAPFQP
jgi:single-strand DNA-binding protein